MTTAGVAPVRSLRSRWNRAFAFMAAVVVLSGLAGLVATRLLLDRFRDSAVALEQAATTGAELRAAIVAHAVVVVGEASDDQPQQIESLHVAIRSGFGQAIAGEDDIGARSFFRDASERWEEMAAATDPVRHPTGRSEVRW